MKKRLSKLELQVSYLQNEISNIAIRLNQSHSFSLYSEAHQLYHTKKISVFDQLEAKVRELEREEEIVGLESINLQEQLATLEASSGVNDELTAIKIQLTGDSINQISLSAANNSATISKDSAVDAELEELRAQLNDK